MANEVRELTSAIASGDTEALSHFYRAWFEFAFNEARRCTGRDEHFCLDAVQETMLRVIKRMKPLETDAALAAWLRTAVHSACIDLLRKELRLKRRDRTYAGHRDKATLDAATTELQETLTWLRDELAQADPTCVRALDMRFRLNWTLARIGQTLHLRTGAVDGRINRAVAQLRAAAREDSHE